MRPGSPCCLGVLAPKLLRKPTAATAPLVSGRIDFSTATADVDTIRCAFATMTLNDCPDGAVRARGLNDRGAPVGWTFRQRLELKIFS